MLRPWRAAVPCRISIDPDFGLVLQGQAVRAVRIRTAAHGQKARKAAADLHIGETVRPEPVADAAKRMRAVTGCVLRNAGGPGRSDMAGECAGNDEVVARSQEVALLEGELGAEPRRAAAERRGRNVRHGRALGMNGNDADDVGSL